jgi:hypothetical protein
VLFSCHHAFDFDGGCFALSCPNLRCGRAFCGYCFHIAPNGDAHSHTAQCRFNEFGLFGGHATNTAVQKANFERAQRSRRVRALRQYLGRLAQGKRNRLLRDLVTELRDYGLVNESFEEGI